MGRSRNGILIANKSYMTFWQLGSKYISMHQYIVALWISFNQIVQQSWICWKKNQSLFQTFYVHETVSNLVQVFFWPGFCKKWNWVGCRSSQTFSSLWTGLKFWTSLEISGSSGRPSAHRSWGYWTVDRNRQQTEEENGSYFNSMAMTIVHMMYSNLETVSNFTLIGNSLETCTLGKENKIQSKRKSPALSLHLEVCTFSFATKNISVFHLQDFFFR